MYTLLQVYFPTVETSGIEIGREFTFKLTFVLPTSAGATVNCMVINCAKQLWKTGTRLLSYGVLSLLYLWLQRLYMKHTHCCHTERPNNKQIFITNPKPFHKDGGNNTSGTGNPGPGVLTLEMFLLFFPS